VKKKTNHCSVFFTLFMVCLFLLKPAGALAKPLNRTISIQDAIQMGWVEASVDSTDGMGFRQPMVLLHIVNESTTALTITIPIGTQLIASQQNYAPLVIGETLNCNSDPQETLSINVNVFSLSNDLSFPFKSDSNNNRYTIGNVIQGKIVNLLKAIDGHSKGSEYGSQLAVWSMSTGKPLDQIARDLNASSEDKANAQQMLSLASNPPSVTLIIVILLVFAVIIAAGLSLKDIRRPKPHQTPFPKTANPPSTQRPIVSAKFLDQSIASNTKEAVINIPKITEKSPDNQTVVVHLVGLSGPYTDRHVDLKVPSIITRGDIDWSILEDDAVSAPHAILDLTDEPYRVKDLNSKTGVDLEGTHLGNRFTDIKPGQRLRIGSFVIAVNDDSLEIVEGPKAGVKVSHAANLTVISNQKFDTFAMGLEDMRVSDAHAILYEQNGEVFIRDLNSSNGIVVNSKRISVETALISGDRLCLGNSEFLVQ
jgi:pSer/pThr/pTyr-binding forkhead associated (FHA) protein